AARRRDVGVILVVTVAILVLAAIIAETAAIVVRIALRVLIAVAEARPIIGLPIRRLGARFARGRQFAERHGNDLLGAFAVDHELDGSAGRHAADALGKIARVLDRRAIDRNDHVAGLDTGFGGRTVLLRLGHQRAIGALETEILCNFGRDGLYLH